MDDFDFCCASREEIAVHVADVAPGMTDDEIEALPRPVQAAARAVRDAVALADREGFRECNTRELLRQIGIGNILAISGGRKIHRLTGVTLPAGCGYSVTVDLAGNDTYVIRRIFSRAGRTWVKGERTGIYCTEVGEQAYQASCFRNVPFGDAR